MDGLQLNRERWMAIAYLALCALHDLDEGDETVAFREARLELHRLLDQQLPEQQKGEPGRPPLYVVR